MTTTPADSSTARSSALVRADEAREGYRPPAPRPGSRLASFASIVLDKNLLKMLPARAYEVFMGSLEIGRRRIFVVNHPQSVRDILVSRWEEFPKSDIMVAALETLVGEGIFISNGETWKRQRRMVDPAFRHMRIRRAFAGMSAAVDASEARLDGHARAGRAFRLDEELSNLTADIIFRAIFSQPIESGAAQRVFEAFAVYQKKVSEIDPLRIVTSRPWAPRPASRELREVCAVIRGELGVLVDARLGASEPGDDIAGDLIAARDPESGSAFSREELIDQLAVFFLAGHETSASVLTWALFILSQRSDTAERLREEVVRVAGAGPVELDHIKALGFTRNVFLETMRLYPPVSFLSRIALNAESMRNHDITPGALMVVSPWLIHRHRRFWVEPELFDPDRFTPEREAEQFPGAYLPFGAGPRVCAGASFATVEGALILARLIRRYAFETLRPDRVRPVTRLTTRPRGGITCRVRQREAEPDGGREPASAGAMAS